MKDRKRTPKRSAAGRYEACATHADDANIPCAEHGLTGEHGCAEYEETLKRAVADMRDEQAHDAEMEKQAILAANAADLKDRLEGLLDALANIETTGNSRGHVDLLGKAENDAQTLIEGLDAAIARLAGSAP